MAREYCSSCELVKNACVCLKVCKQTNSLPVIILRHPDEAKKPLGTAKLANLGLENIAIHTAANIDESVFMGLVSDFQVQNPILLYDSALPESSGFTIDVQMSKPGCLGNFGGYDALVVLDGTWRNTRELFMCNRWLQFLPRLTLRGVPSSRYRIRKTDKKDALSTIEAIGCVLSLVDSSFVSADLLSPFEAMIDYQINKMGQALYEQNYG